METWSCVFCEGEIMAATDGYKVVRNFRIKNELQVSGRQMG